MVVTRRQAAGRGDHDPSKAAAGVERDLSTATSTTSFSSSKRASPPPPTTTTLLDWSQIEPWQQDNHYIRTSYRPASYSYAASFRSLFYLHNEFVNIHTHLFGGLLFAAIPLYLYLKPSPPPEPVTHLPHPSPWTTADTIAFACFFVGAVTCLLMSAVYHAISNHSHAVCVFGNKLDYVGIVLLISGSFAPSVYYGFRCDVAHQRLYWAMISLLGLACAAASTVPAFRTPAWRPFRAAMFVGMGLSAVFPVLHGLARWGVRGMQDRIGLAWLLLQGVLYITGAGLYAARIPEKWSPGTFDVWGSSHQIFHVLVVLAACSHLMGLLKAGEFARANVSC